MNPGKLNHFQKSTTSNENAADDFSDSFHSADRASLAEVTAVLELEKVSRVLEFAVCNIT